MNRPILPSFTSLPLADGLRRDWRGWLVQEKSDGCHEFLTHGGSVFNAERMPAGAFVVNDLISVNGQDLRRESTAARWRWLNELARQGALPANARLSRAGFGVEMIEAEAGRNGPADTDPQPDPACQCDLCRQNRQDAESERIAVMLDVTRQTLRPTGQDAATATDGGKQWRSFKRH